jgi:hypothetical protein
MNRLHRLLHRHRWIVFTITSKVTNTTHTFTVRRCWCGAYGLDQGE